MWPLHPDPGSTTGAVMGMIFFALWMPNGFIVAFRLYY